MAKSNKARLKAVPPSKDGKPRRFADDDLYDWAQLVAAQHNLSAQIAGFVNERREKYRITQNEMPDDRGYIVPMQRGPIQMTAEQPGETGEQTAENQS